jgi:hypothetical protein
MEQIDPLAHEFAGNSGQSCHVPASNEAEFSRIGAKQEKYWNCGGGSLRRERRRAPIESHNHGHLPLHEFRRKRRQLPSLVIAPAEFHCHVAALDVARRGEPLKECGYAVDSLHRRTKGQIPDHWHRLRPRSERTRRCSSKTCDELPPLHL